MLYFKKTYKRIIFKLLIRKKQLPLESRHSFTSRFDVLSYYLKRIDRKLSIEEKVIIKYLKKNPIHYFPYRFKDKYISKNLFVYYDNEVRLHYVIHQNKKLYFKKSWSVDKIKEAYNFLLIEQDVNSPHRYLSEAFNVNEGDCILDIGCAEGNFTLDIIERINKAFLFEADVEWIEPLKATFMPWKDKVIIVNKFVSNISNEVTISIDDTINQKIDFIKIDAEGEEIKILNGSLKVIKSNNLRLAVCSYHKSSDADNISEFFKIHNFNYEYSKGLMIFLDNWVPPYMRKVLLRAYSRSI